MISRIIAPLTKAKPNQTTLNLDPLQQFAINHYLSDTTANPISLLTGLLKLSGNINQIKEFSDLSDEINKSLPAKPKNISNNSDLDEKSELDEKSDLNNNSVIELDISSPKKQIALKIKNYIEKIQAIKIKNIYTIKILNIFWSHYPEFSPAHFKLDIEWPKRYYQQFTSKKGFKESIAPIKNSNEHVVKIAKFYFYLSTEEKNIHFTFCLKIIKDGKFNLEKINILKSTFRSLNNEEKIIFLEEIAKRPSPDYNFIATLFEHIPASLKSTYANTLLGIIYNSRLKSEIKLDLYENSGSNYYQYQEIYNAIPQLFDFLTVENQKHILDMLIIRTKILRVTYASVHSKYYYEAYHYLCLLFAKAPEEYQKEILTIFLFKINDTQHTDNLSLDIINRIHQFFLSIISELSIETLLTFLQAFMSLKVHCETKRQQSIDHFDATYLLSLKTIFYIFKQLKLKEFNHIVPETYHGTETPLSLDDMLFQWAYLPTNQKNTFILECINSHYNTFYIHVMTDYFINSQNTAIKETIRTKLIALSKESNHSNSPNEPYTALATIYKHDTEMGKQVILQQVLISKKGIGHNEFWPLYKMLDETQKSIIFDDYCQKIKSDFIKKKFLIDSIEFSADNQQQRHEMFNLFSVKQRIILIREVIIHSASLPIDSFHAKHHYSYQQLTDLYLEIEKIQSTNMIFAQHLKIVELTRLMNDYAEVNLFSYLDEIIFSPTQPLKQKQTNTIMFFSAENNHNKIDISKKPDKPIKMISKH